MLTALRAVCRRFRTLADARLAKHILLVDTGEHDTVGTESPSPYVFAMRPPQPGLGAVRGPLLGSLRTLQSGFLHRALGGGVVDMAQLGAFPDLQSPVRAIRLRSAGPFDSGSLALCAADAHRVVQFLVVTPANDPFADIPLLPANIARLVFHISYDSTAPLLAVPRSVPFESYRRQRVVFILHDAPQGNSSPAACALSQLMSHGRSLLTALAPGFLWYALAGARVTVVGLDAVPAGWLGTDIMRNGRVSARAVRRWLQDVGLDEPYDHAARTRAWKRVTFCSHESYRAWLGDDDYALETVE